MYSQSSIRGVVQSLEGPISGASVTIKQTGTDNILAYDITHKAGEYVISLNSKEKNVTINVRFLGYRSESKDIENKTQTIDFMLSEEVTELKEVTVTPPPIRLRGDTISFDVKSFATEKDRTISDVLKKMPGITVKSSGQILYKGEPITKYYIEGLDLLGGRYSLANENLSHDQVSKVEILENHQPIKALDSLVFSDKAALNIKLKNKVSITGQAQLGVGFPPLLWDANITPMLFAKKQQMIASYQVNNLGNDLGLQLKYLLPTGAMMSDFDFEDYFDEKSDWVSIPEVGGAYFSGKRWLDNATHALSTNYLRKTKKDYEFRVNVSYLNDYQKQEGTTHTLTFTPSDTISITENTNNKSNSNILQTGFSIEKNAKKKYFRNQLNFEGSWDSKKGSVLLNDDDPVNQDLNNKYFKLSNQLNTIFPVGKQLIRLNSLTSFSLAPQRLSVTPGQFQERLNNDKDYNRMTQEVRFKTFYANNSIGLTKAVKRFTFSPKIGIRVRNQNLKSNLAISPEANLGKAFFNDLNWTHTKTYFDVHTQYKKNRWRIELSTPINYHTYAIEDQPLEEKQNLNRFTFEPRLSINNKLNAYWEANSSYGISNRFGTVNQIHYAYIVKSYRNIQRLDTQLPETRTRNFMTRVSYKNPIRSLFGNISYSFSNSENNLLFSSRISEEGEKEIEAVERENNTKSHNISSRISQNVRKLKTTFTLGSRVSFQESQQIINEEMTNVKNKSLRVDMKTNTELTDWLDIEYQTEWSFSKNQLRNTKNQTIINQSHNLDISIYPIDNHYIGIKSEYAKNDLSSDGEGYFFVDFLYRYTWKKKKIDFELQWTNMLNTKTFNRTIVNSFNYIKTNFNLRPSQILFKVKFPL